MNQLQRIYAAEMANAAKLAVLDAKLDCVLAILCGPGSIAAAQISLWQGASNTMLKPKSAKAAVVGDFQLLDNGTATGTISFTDAAGEPATLQTGATVTTTLVSSDPDLTATIDSTGLIITIAVSLVTPLPTLPISDITITATVNISNPDGTSVGPLTAVSQGIDLVAGGPAGASISLS